MRTGQYKFSCSGGMDEERNGIGGIGQFKHSCKELPPLSTFTLTESLNGENFPHVNSLIIACSKNEEGRKIRNRNYKRDKEEELIREWKRNERIMRHRSCENVSWLPRGAVNRVEQKVRSLLLKGDSKQRGEITINNMDLFEGDNRSDIWQVGRVVTMPKKSRLSTTQSHSALHTISSDTASCLSASSGYSSSNNSSYGSFKSSGSYCSTLPRHRNNSNGSQSPISNNNRIILVDNPLYDISPMAASRLYDASRYCEVTTLESLSSGEFSLVEGCHSLTDPLQDPIAKQCREFFEKRVQSSENLRKRWSLSLPDPNLPKNDPQLFSEVVLNEDINNLSKYNFDYSGIGFGGGSIHGISEEQEYLKHIDANEINMDVVSLTSFNPKPKVQKKNQLDEKMEFLRQEIGSLMQQDNSLFQQLLALHDSISTLKVQNTLGHTHALRPHTPSSLDSFTEEEEDEDDDEDDEDAEEGNEDEVEKRQTHSEVKKEFEPCHSENLANEQVGMTQLGIIEDDEDEGHGTDLSLGHTPSHSPSPASTLSSSSSKDSSFSRSLCDMSLECSSSGSFTRSRKSYAPNARNRRRASSVHRQKASKIHCDTTMALVVVHTDDEDALLGLTRPRAHTFTPTSHFQSQDSKKTTFFSEASSNFINRSLSQHTLDLFSLSPFKAAQKAKKSVQKQAKNGHSSCSSETVTTSPSCASTRPTLSHPPYREALIM